MKKQKCAILLAFAICHLASLQLSFIHEMLIKCGKVKLNDKSLMSNDQH